MKKLLYCLFLISVLFSVFGSIAAERSDTVVPPAQSNDIQLPWAETMRIYLGKFGSCNNENELESVLRSRAVDPSKPMIALTFDDGPVAGVTDQILDILEENNARATFFIIGCRLKKEANAAILPRMLALGCEIGNHTYNHEKLKNVSNKYQKNTVQRVNDAVYELTGFYPTSLRPPGGMTGNNVIKNAGEIGMTVVLWSQSGDVHATNPQKIADNVFRQSANGRELKNGDIILLHDTKATMVEAVRLLVPKLIEEGYQLVTVKELLEHSEIGYLCGYQYRSIEDYKTND